MSHNLAHAGHDENQDHPEEHTGAATTTEAQANSKSPGSPPQTSSTSVQSNVQPQKTQQALSPEVTYGILGAVLVVSVLLGIIVQRNKKLK